MTATMRAVWYERTGPAEDVLTVGELPRPQPAPGEVLVRLHASGVNPADCNRRGGRNYPEPDGITIPNSDGAGVIEALGNGVTEHRRGDRVWLYNGARGRSFGTAAEFITLDADLVAPLPDGVPFEVGAALGIPAMTAHRCLFADGPVRGQTVLVTGGAGAVGNYAIQLAKWDGARVITTVSSPEKAEDARRAGADIVLDYRRENVVEAVLQATGGKGVERIVEVDFGGNQATTLEVIALNGTVAAYASRGNLHPVLEYSRIMRRNMTLRTVLLFSAPHKARRQAQREIVAWLEAAPRFHRTAAMFPLAETAKAHLAVERGDKRGMVVVAPNL